MKRAKVSSAIIGLMGFAALVLVASTPAKAAFVVGGENGWQMSFDGMINAMMTYSMTDTVPAGDRASSNTSNFTIGQESRDRQVFRVRTGLLPSIFAFNVKSPTINGVDYAARVGLYPQIQNDTTRTGFGPDFGGNSRIDIREVFMTADGKFGQVLAGRALCLYQGKNILTDMTLIGVGVPGAQAIGKGTTLGHIGYGYVYPTFNAQFRYTSPDMNGLKVAVAVNDPSKIAGSGFTADKTNQPRFETELSYATKLSFGDLSTWVSALYQEAKSTNPDLKGKVASIGGAGGVQLGMGPVGLMVSGYGGQALGSTFLQDFDALDELGKERTQYGGLAQVTYQLGPAKLGLNYGMNYSARTDYEEDDAAPSSILKSQQAATGGVYYSINKYMTVVGEYTWARNSWYDGEHQDCNAISLGTVFTW
ncbi:MAG: porin [Deltaproteobacteria bacterium]|nr:porin [Deltaproteobacteria bacterium]